MLTWKAVVDRVQSESDPPVSLEQRHWGWETNGRVSAGYSDGSEVDAVVIQVIIVSYFGDSWVPRHEIVQF